MNVTIQDITQMITASGIVIGIIGGFIAWLTTMYRRVNGIYRTIKVIEKEFSPNGGRSIRDSINRIDENQSNLMSLKHSVHAYWDKTLDIPMFIADRSGSCTWANKAYLKLTNRNLDEILDGNWEITVHQEDRESVREEWYNACEDGRSFEIIYRINSRTAPDNYVKCTVYGDTHCGYVAFLEKIDAKQKMSLKKTGNASITNSEVGKEKGE